MAGKSGTAENSVLTRPVRRLVIGMTAAAVCCLIASLAFTVSSEPPVWWQFGACVAVFALGAMASFPIRVGSQHVLIAWLEAAVVIGLALIPLPWIVPAIALGAVVAFAWRSGQPVKKLYSGSMETVAAAAVVGLVYLSGHTGISLATPREIAVVVLVVALFGQLTDLATAVAIGLAERRSILGIFRSRLSVNVLSQAGNLTATLVVLVLVKIDPRVLVVLPLVLLCLRQAYLGRQRGQEERESWQGLLEATRELSDLDERVVLSRGVRLAARMFSTDTVEVELTRGWLVRGDEHGLRYAGAVADAPERVAHTVVERQLGGDPGGIGVLRLCFRGDIGLNDREHAMLGAIAAELHSALVNAAQHAEARHQATHDPLTGLLNRAGLLAAAAGSIAAAADDQVDSAVVLIDLTGFREIVDTLGHAAGDAVLVHTAARLTAAAMPGELVGRLDSDDFVVLLPKLTDPTQATTRTEALLGALAVPTEIDGAALPVSGVAGIAYAVRGGIRLEELLRQAGVALHGVRASGGRIQYYLPERDVRSVSRVVLASELRAALRGMHELDLVYQPILDLHTGEAISAEALVRWNHPTRGQLTPDEFLPVVEHAGLLPELTGRVFDIALSHAADWARQGILVPVAVNVSPRTLLDSDFPGQVAAALSRHRVPAERVTLEITETSVLSHLAVVDRVLDELRDLGVRLSLDDFGTGWSSLSHLARVPVHEVKIAATFTERLLSSPQAAAVVRGTLEIGRALDLRVVAEGVTGAIQRATLVSLGCHAGQGMHFFPPLSAERIGPALWSSTVRALAASEGADVISLSQRRPPGTR